MTALEASINAQTVASPIGQHQHDLSGSINGISEGIGQIEDSITRIREVYNKVTNLITRIGTDAQADFMLLTTLTSKFTLCPECERSRNSGLALILKNSNETAVRTKQLLVEIKRETDAQRLATPENCGDAATLDEVTSVLLSRFLLTTNEYVKSQREYKADIEREIIAQVLIRKRDATSDEIEAAFTTYKSREQAVTTSVVFYEDRYPVAPASYTPFESTEIIVDEVTLSYPDWSVLSDSLSDIHQLLHYYFLLLKSKENKSINCIEEGNRCSLRDLMHQEQPKDNSHRRTYHILRTIAGAAILATIVIIIVYVGVFRRR